MIKAIFFDLMNVIFKGGFLEAIEEYGRELNIDPNEIYKIIHDFDGWKSFSLGKISQDEFYRMCSERAAGRFNFEGEHFSELLKKNIEPNLEMTDLIKSLSGDHIIGVVSNIAKEWYGAIIKKIDFSDTIKVKAISGYLHVRKPDEQIFSIALDKAGVKGEEAIYVDDRSDRIDGAQKLGIKIIIFDGDIEKFKNNLNIYIDNYLK